MNAPPKPQPAPPDAAAPAGWTADGYEDWLAAEIAAGERQLDEGKAAPFDRVKKEFGVE